MVVRGRSRGAIQHVPECRAVNRVVEDGQVAVVGDCVPFQVRVHAMADVRRDVAVVDEDLRAEAHAADRILCGQRMVTDGIAPCGARQHLIVLWTATAKSPVPRLP